MSLKAILYTAFLLAANSALADVSSLEALRDGTMKKLQFSEPSAVPEATLPVLEGGETSLADYRGKHVLVNFWATWCAPCRKEMPMLSELQSDYGGSAFEVVTIATGRNPEPAIRGFFEEIGVDNLPVLLDARQGLSRDMGVLGLPVTILVDPEGLEIARMLGDAEWNGESARAIIEALIEAEPEG